MMNKIKEIFFIILFVIIFPIAIFFDWLYYKKNGKSIDEEWHEIYVYGQANHGQGRKVE